MLPCWNNLAEVSVQLLLLLQLRPYTAYCSFRTVVFLFKLVGVFLQLLGEEFALMPGCLLSAA